MKHTVSFILHSSLLAYTYSLSFIAPQVCHRFANQCSGSGSCSRSFLDMKVSKGKSKHSKGNSLHSQNQYRKRIAGKPGTKLFLDPNKAFIGNLSYDTTVDDVKVFLKQHLGSLSTVESVKIIQDWKTNKSKGYGFVQFVEPMFATSAMESIKNKKLKGRVLRLDQGRKKDDLNNRVLFVKKRERIADKPNVDEEDRVIDGALDEVDKMRNDDEDDDVYSVEDFEDDADDLMFGDDGDDDDDDDDGIDGWYEEMYGSSKWEELDEEEAKNKNREQRREAQRLKPRKKLPRKGFGVQD